MYVMVFDRQHVETVQVDIFSSESDDVVKKCGSVSFHVYSFDLFRLLINTICIVPIIFWQTKGYIVTAPFSWFIFNQERVDFMKLILLSLITNKNNSFKSMNEISDSVVNNSEKSLLKLMLHYYEIIKKVYIFESFFFVQFTSKFWVKTVSTPMLFQCTVE